MRLSVSVMMAGYDKRGSNEDHIRRKEGDGEGSAGKEAEGSQLNPNDLAKLRKVFILPVKDVSLKLKRAWKMTKAQQGLACVVCGKPLSNLKVAQTHVQNKSHQLKQKEHQLLEYLPTIPKLSTSYFCALSSFLTRVFNQHSAQAQLNDRHKIANRLEHYLKEDGLDATVCLFGSSGSGFALTSSNVNLSVSTAGTSGNQSVIAGCMKSVAVSLKKRGDVYGNVQEDYFSFNKIPRILFEHLKSGLSCEVRVEAGNPVALCSLLKLYAAVDERCVQLSTLFRLWAKVCRVDIQENGHYPGHMFVVMAIYFLQQIGVLPVLHQLHNSKQKNGATVNKRHGNRKNKQGDNTTTQLETGRGVTVVQMKQMEEGEGGGEVDSGATGVVLNDDDDDVVFVEECEGEREVNEVNKVEEGEEEGSMGTGEGMPTKLPHVPDIDYLTDLTELQNRWKSTNTQSLGELWYHLLKYYAVEFNIEQHAVSIRQKQKLLRLTRQWGEVRLAVEDPLIPKSNLARAASSRQVYDYLMSSLRLSALYFSGCSDQMQWATLDEPVVAENIGAKQDVRTKPSPSIQDKESWQEPDSSAKSPPLLQLDQCVQEDDKEGGDEGGSIEHQDSSILFASVPSETSSHELLNKNDCTSIDNIANMVQRLKISEDCVVGIKATSIEEGIVCTSSTPKQDECSPHCSTSSTPHSPPETAPPPSLPSSGTGSSPQSLPVICASPLEAGLSTDKQLGLKFAAENFVFLSYPQSCLNCKKLKHSILECPELDLAVEYRKHLPRHLPSPAALQQVHQCFTENMRKELLDEAHMQMRRDILASILEDIHVLYPCAELEMFGSSANGFGSKGSDLDICLTLPGHDKNMREKIIELIATQFAKDRKKYDQIVPITTARVPIVKFYMRPWRMQCDISLENKLALRNTRLLAAYTKIDPRVPKLGCALKRLAKSCDMCDAAAGSLSSYAYVLMLLHYLQTVTPPILPILQQLHPESVTVPEHIIDDWNCYFYEFECTAKLKEVWSVHGTNKSSTGELWLGMLRYYTTEFDWNQNVVTIKQCTPLSKFDKWWMGKCMCIEDPFNLDHNLGGGITNRMRAYILDRFMDTLRFHSEDRPWNSIQDLMDPVALKGETRPPKFMRCHNCGSRGHKAAECPSKDASHLGNQSQHGFRHGSHQNSKQSTTQEERNVSSRQPEHVARSQERLVYNVGPSPRKPRREQRPPSGQRPLHMMPVQCFAHHTLIPPNSSSRPLLPSTPVHMTHAYLPPASIPTSVYNQYPPGLGYPTNISAAATVHPGTVPMPLVSRNVPYSRSSSYPLHHSERMVTPQPQTQYPSVLPHSVHRSPPYRQIQQSGTLQHQVANTSYPPLSSSDGSHSYPLGHNPQVPYRHGNTAVLTMHESVPPVVSSPRQSHNSSKHRRRGKRN